MHLPYIIHSAKNFLITLALNSHSDCMLVPIILQRRNRACVPQISRSLTAHLRSSEPDLSSANTENLNWASLVAQMVKNLSAMQETWVGSLGQEDPLEKGMAPHSSILLWKVPWTEEPGGLQSGDHKDADTLSTHTLMKS